MLTQFFAWWVEQMAGFLPASLLPASSPANALVVDLAPTGLVVRERRRRHETERQMGTGPEPLLHLVRSRPGFPVVFRPAPASLLERDVALPAAAGSELVRALTYEMDRFTPFRAEQVYWTHRLLARGGVGGVLRVRLSVIPRVALRGLPELCAASSRTKPLIEVPARDGQLRVIPVTPDATVHGRTGGRIARWAVLALAAAVVVTPFVRQSIAQAGLDRQTAALRPRIALAQRLRARIGGEQAAGTVLARQAARYPDPLRVLAALTTALPDDSFLTSLELHDAAVTIEGEAASAAKLVSILSADPVFGKLDFTAPVTRSPQGREVFSLRARIVTAPPPSSPSSGQ